MSEEPRERSPSSGDSSEDIEVTTDEPVATSPAARRAARRARNKHALRIPDDEIARPQPKTNGDAPEAPAPDAKASAAQARVTTPDVEPAIKPSRIISVGPPPPDVVPDDPTPPRIPVAPPTAKIDEPDEAQTPMVPAVKAKAPSVPADDADGGIDVPVDEDEPEYRPRTPTIPSNPPPSPAAA